PMLRMLSPLAAHHLPIRDYGFMPIGQFPHRCRRGSWSAREQSCLASVKSAYLGAFPAACSGHRAALASGVLLRSRSKTSYAATARLVENAENLNVLSIGWSGSANSRRAVATARPAPCREILPLSTAPARPT